MTSFLDRASIVYIAADLLPAKSCLPGRYNFSQKCEFVAVGHCSQDNNIGMHAVPAGCWFVASVTHAQDTYAEYVIGIFDHEPTVGEVRERVAYAAHPDYQYSSSEQPWQPFQAAEPIARRWAKKCRLTPAELLADPRFRAEARRVAQKNKNYSSTLLEWEKKDIVSAAVAIVRAEVEAEQVAAAAKQAAEAAALAEKREQERPTREAVLAAYAACNFRRCKHGHDVSVSIGNSVYVRSGIEYGEKYSSRCTFKKMHSVHTLGVNGDWLSAVHDTGGGLLNINDESCLVIDAPFAGWNAAKVPVFCLTAARQGRGTHLEVNTVSAIVIDGQWVITHRPVTIPATALHTAVASAAVDRAEALRTAAIMPPDVFADWLQDRDADPLALAPLRS